MPLRNGMPSEADEQVALFQWATLMENRVQPLRMLFAIPNGGSRNRLEAINLKRQGVKAGVPDLCLAYPAHGFHGLYIEMKVGKNKPSDKQKVWIANLQTAGYKVSVCYGFDAAKKIIEEYLEM